jgi:GNAT superfamily N-acetyltransferase
VSIDCFFFSCAALVCAFGPVAEVPVLAVRPEVQGSGLGRLLLSQLESALLEAGAKLLAMPTVLQEPEPAPPPVKGAKQLLPPIKVSISSLAAFRVQ